MFYDPRTRSVSPLLFIIIGILAVGMVVAVLGYGIMKSKEMEKTSSQAK